LAHTKDGEGLAALSPRRGRKTVAPGVSLGSRRTIPSSARFSGRKKLPKNSTNVAILTRGSTSWPSSAAPIDRCDSASGRQSQPVHRCASAWAQSVHRIHCNPTRFRCRWPAPGRAHRACGYAVRLQIPAPQAQGGDDQKLPAPNGSRRWVPQSGTEPQQHPPHEPRPESAFRAPTSVRTPVADRHRLEELFSLPRGP